MKVYCADSQDIMNNPQILKKLPSFNILTSFYYIKDLSIYLPFANNMLIDSGAFTLQQKKKANYTKYFKEYCKFVEAHHNNPKIQGFFELDIHEKDPLEIFVEGNDIILKKFEPNCIFCGSTKKVIKFKDKLICSKCYDQIKNTEV